MRLLTVGDSFTYGAELDNLTDAWPYVLSEYVAAELTNLGQPGSSNTKMVRKIVEHIHNYDLIIIAWSHYARVEFADHRGVYDIWPGSNLLVHNTAPHRKEISSYITKYHSDVYFYKQYLINILLIQSFLKQHNKRYIMVNSFGNNRSDFKDNSAITNLADQIDCRYFLGWPDESMMEWTYGCAQGPDGHFLEDGHKRVAEKINEHIRHLGWVS